MRNLASTLTAVLLTLAITTAATAGTATAGQKAPAPDVENGAAPVIQVQADALHIVAQNVAENTAIKTAAKNGAEATPVGQTAAQVATNLAAITKHDPINATLNDATIENRAGTVPVPINSATTTVALISTTTKATTTAHNRE